MSVESRSRGVSSASGSLRLAGPRRLATTSGSSAEPPAATRRRRRLRYRGVSIASTALAHECINASKADQSAGAQIVFGPEGEVIYVSTGLARRIEQGLVDLESGDGFHGLVRLDMDGDGAVDLATWIGVGPDGEIPLTAQLRGPACRGLTNIGLYFEQCAAGR